MCITVDSLDLDDTIADLDQRDIECAAAEIVDHDRLVLLVIKTIGKGCCRRLVDDTLDIETSDTACILCCLSLCVIEVRRNCDDSLCDLLTEISFCVCLQLLKNHSGDFLRCVGLAAGCDLLVCAHLSLDGRNCICRVRDCLTLSRLTDKSLTCLCKCDDRRCCSCAFRVRDNCRLTAFHDSYAAVCCTKIDTNDLTHICYLLIQFGICT